MRSAVHHQAGLLQNKIARLDDRRVAQLRRVELAFNVDLLAIVESHSPQILDLVQMGLDNDPGSRPLAMALRKARNPMRTLVMPEDPHERPTDAEELAPPRLPGLLAMTHPAFNDNGPATPRVPPPATYERSAVEMVQGVNGILARVPEVAECDMETAGWTDPAPAPERVYRYPEPGEAAMTLPDGRVVAVDP